MRRRERRSSAEEAKDVAVCEWCVKTRTKESSSLVSGFCLRLNFKLRTATFRSHKCFDLDCVVRPPFHARQCLPNRLGDFTFYPIDLW